MIRVLHFVGMTAVLSFAGGSALAQTGATIPAQFHGRWAPNPAACRDTGANDVRTIDAQGYGESEYGARVTRRGQVRSGTHHFRAVFYGGANENPGTLALRLTGGRLAVSLSSSGQTTHQSLIRCR